MHVLITFIKSFIHVCMDYIQLIKSCVLLFVLSFMYSFIHSFAYLITAIRWLVSESMY